MMTRKTLAPALLCALVVLFAALSLRPAASTVAPRWRVVAFGDSLTAGYGLDPSDAFPPVLAARLRGAGYPVTIDNAGVSGETTRQGLARLPAALASHPDLVILELGANDMLNGVDPAKTQDNLDRMIRLAQKAGARVLLAGMVAIDQSRPQEKRRFDAIFPTLAQKYRLPLYPQFLEGVGANPELTQPGGLHPTKQGVRKIVERIAPLVEKTLKEMAASRR